MTIKLKLPFDHTILGYIEGKNGWAGVTLVRNDECRYVVEYATYRVDSEGYCHLGYYTHSLKRAKEDFKERAGM